MNTVICSITKGSKASNTILWYSLQKIGDIEVNFECNNTLKGLSKYYNECIEKYKDTDCIVFTHDDVDIINSDLTYQLQTAFQHYDVVGVAGCVNPKILDRNLWHWMAGDKGNCRGIAGHPVSKKEFYVTSFGPTPSRAVIIDGVFMALKTDKIYKSKVRFDEQFMFHHYDIDFSLTCNKNGIRIGVWPLLINHQSPGLKDFDSKWNDSNQKFLNKWKNK